jgi:hypothetical protein
MQLFGAAPVLVLPLMLLLFLFLLLSLRVRYPTTIAPDVSLHPFGSGQSLNPYPNHYSSAFAFCILLYPLPRQLSLRIACRQFNDLIWRRGIGLTTFPEIPNATNNIAH